MPLRVVVAADSLGLPRRKPDPVSHEEAWPAVLEDLLQDRAPGCRVLNHAERSRTLPDLVHRFDDVVGLWAPDAVVVQVGIVDCAPRLFSRRQHFLLSSRLLNWGPSRPIIALASRYRRTIIRLRPWVRYTPPIRFERALEGLGARLKSLEVPVVVLPILGTYPEHEHRSPGYNRSVERYNALWRAACARHGLRFLEYGEAFGAMGIAEVVASDGHHLSVAGNRRAAEAVASVLEGMPAPA